LPVAQIPAASAQGYAPTFELTGVVTNPKTFALDDLRGYSGITLKGVTKRALFEMTAAFGATQSFQVGKFTGVSLWDLLQEAGVQNTSGRNNDKLRKYAVATVSDGYDAMFSLADLDPEFGAELVLVAYLRDGEALSPNEGMARTVIASDKRGGRLVSNVVRIEVRDVDSAPQ
jgi:DMSO/TMAO reductase YedYZ molybdopterin-dependent catalytic subunit